MKIAKWHTWQTFRKDRGTPPWIKVYRNLMTNSEWVSLSDAEKGQLVSMWILASDKSGFIPDDAKLVQRMAMLDGVPNLNKFIKLGFLVSTCQPCGNHLVTDAPEVGEAETETETETETEKKTLTSNLRFDEWWNLYPKKIEKKKALATWKRRKLDTIADQIIEDTRNRPTQCAKWKAGYVCNPTTYLNGDRWNDEYEKPNGNNGRAHQPRETTVQRQNREAREAIERANSGI